MLLWSLLVRCLEVQRQAGTSCHVILHTIFESIPDNEPVHKQVGNKALQRSVWHMHILGHNKPPQLTSSGL